MKTVSVIIPTLNASEWLPEQLSALHAQTAAIAEIILVDSQSDDNTRQLAAADSLCTVVPVLRDDFDHGATRDMAARSCHSDYLWFLTQDAIPADSRCLEELLHAVENETIACAYGRQMAAKNASQIETLNRAENYPDQGFIRTAKDIPVLQIRAFFLSNTCCLYKRDIYLKCGGFQHNLPMNEDMLIAAKFLANGYATAYCAKAKVWHTHHMTLKQWYQRSFDTGAFMTLFRAQLHAAESAGAGKQYVFSVLRKLLRKGSLFTAFHFILISAVRMFGNFDGQHYSKFTDRALLRRTQNPVFWKRYLKANYPAHLDSNSS